MRILEKIEIYQGDWSPIINLGVSGEHKLSGYTCETRVIDKSAKEIIKPRRITEIFVDGAKEVFAISLRASETKLLKPGLLYIWIIEIKNDAVFYKEETRIGLFIKDKGEQ